jgi:Uma2 family endonuclease
MNQQSRVLTAREWRVPFTADDFVRMMDLGAFADMRAELVRGEIEKMLPAHWTHGELNLKLGARILATLGSSGARAGTDVLIRINDTTVRAADLAVIRAEAQPTKVLEGSDILLVVEIAETTLDRDMADKRVDYASVGVPSYWVVDSNRRVIHRFDDPVDGDYAKVATSTFDEVVPVPGSDGGITLA